MKPCVLHALVRGYILMTIRLLPDERALYDAILPSVRASVRCEVLVEDPAHLETSDQCAVRLRILSDHPTDGLRSIARALNNAPDATFTPDLSGLTPEDLSLLFSAIGARGLSLLIAIGFERCTTPDDLRAITHLTSLRHGLLLSNADFFRTPHA